VEDLLSAALFLLFVGGVTFSWVDWRRRARKLPARAMLSWSCPNCLIVNEGDLGSFRARARDVMESVLGGSSHVP